MTNDSSLAPLLYIKATFYSLRWQGKFSYVMYAILVYIMPVWFGYYIDSNIVKNFIYSLHTTS